MTPTKASAMDETTYGPNPLKKLRNKYSVTQYELANLAGVSPQAVVKYEQGLYQDPSDKIVDALIKIAADHNEDITFLSVYDAYQSWRLTHQRAQRWRFDELRTIPYRKNEHPFVSLRRAVGHGYTCQGFAVLLALHPATVSNYNSGRVRVMPSIIREALERAGCRGSLINEVDTFGQHYFDRKN